MDAQGVPTSDSAAMTVMFEGICSKIENWDCRAQRDNCLEILEDSCAAFLPCVHYLFRMDHSHLIATVRRMKDSAPGPDGWHRSEILSLSLPVEALADFVISSPVMSLR